MTSPDTIEALGFTLRRYPLPEFLGEAWGSPVDEGPYAIVRSRPFDRDASRRWVAEMFSAEDGHALARGYGATRDAAVEACRMVLETQVRTALGCARPEVQA